MRVTRELDLGALNRLGPKIESQVHAALRTAKVGQRERNRPDVLTVDIDFRRRIDAWICDFKRQKRGQRFRFNRKLEHRALVGPSIKPNCFGGQSGSHSSEVLDVFGRRVQRGDH